MLTHDSVIPTLPSSTVNGFFSLTTTPGLTLHRRDYARLPRLTPLQSQVLRIPSNDIHHAPEPVPPQIRKRRKTIWSQDQHHTRSSQSQQTPLDELDHLLPSLQRRSWISFPSSLTAPIPFSTVRDCISETDLIQSPPPPERTPENRSRYLDAFRRGNLLTTFKVADHDTCLLSNSGKLASLAAYTLSSSHPSSTSLTKFTSCHKLPEIIQYQQEPLINITSSKFDNNETLLATTINTLSLATVTPDGLLKWDDHLYIPNITASSLNPLYPQEFALLSSDGLFTGTADQYRDYQKSPDQSRNFFDVQCVQPESQFRQVQYGTHPRKLWLASRKQILQLDLRTARERTVIFDLRSNQDTMARDSEIGTFCHAPNSNGFRLLLATRASLTYLDTRRPQVPILDWSLDLPCAPDKIAAVALNPDTVRTDAVAVASSRWGYVELFHALHTDHHDPITPFHRTEQHLFSMPRTELVWSDLPLRAYSSSPFQDAVDGLSVLATSDDRRTTVLQWSGRTGLTLHPFEVAPKLDHDQGMAEGVLRTRSENSINLRNSISSLAPFSPRRCSCDRFPVSRSNPGSYLHGRLKRLLLRDVKELRRRICSAEDDDTDDASSIRIPRPYMRDLVSSERNDGDIKSPMPIPDEASQAQPSQRDERAQGDDTADRETIIGEAALMKSEESEDSDNPESGSLDFIDAIGSGCLFDELSRSVRSGFGHHPMPLGVSTLNEAVSESPLTNFYETVWHTQCEQVHPAKSTAVCTADTLPSWVCTTVYFAEEAEKGESLRNSSIPESSQYGALLSRMQTVFFN